MPLHFQTKFYFDLQLKTSKYSLLKFLLHCYNLQPHYKLASQIRIIFYPQRNFQKLYPDKALSLMVSMHSNRLLNHSGNFAAYIFEFCNFLDSFFPGCNIARFYIWFCNMINHKSLIRK